MPDAQWYVKRARRVREEGRLHRCPFKATDGSSSTFESGSAFAIPKGPPNACGMCEFAKLVTLQGAWRAAAAARKQTTNRDHSALTGFSSQYGHHRSDAGQVRHSDWKC